MFDEYKYGLYQTLRTQARANVVDSFNRRIRTPEDRNRWRGITLASMNKEAYEYARIEWPKYYDEATFEGLPHSWERLYFRFMAKPAHFNLAVWQTLSENGHTGKILHGLALGKPSRAKTHLTINWIERSYAPTYLRGGVLLPILACAEEYAKLLGCERVLIKDPLDASPFETLGYALYPDAPGRGVHLSKEL